MRYGDAAGAYSIADMPGCGQVAVSTHAFVYPGMRGNGHGARLHRARVNEMARLGYDYAICTAADGNAAQVALLESAGWQRLATFKSSYTGNNVSLWGRMIERDK